MAFDAAPRATPLSFLAHGGEAAALIRAVDWAATPLGPPAGWSAPLKTVVGVMLHSRQPMFLWWGPELVQLYNDAYLPSFGAGKHPAAMGQRGADCWQEIWPIIWPQIDDVMQRGISSWNEDQLVPIFRNGRIEDVYWTYGYSPVLDEHGVVAGTLVVCSETTSRMVSERRQHVLRGFAETLAGSAPGGDVARLAMDALQTATVDVPAALFYRRAGPDAPLAWLRQPGPDAQGLARADEALQSFLTGHPEALAQLSAGIPVFARALWQLAGPRGPEPVCDALLVPARGAHGQGDIEFIAYGLNPRIPANEAYRAFLLQLTASVSLAKARIDAARVHAASEAERNNLLMQAPVATAVFSGPDMVFELANPLYCKLVGRDDLVGRAYTEALPELVGTALPGILQAVFETGVPYVSPETLIPLDRAGTGTPEQCYFEFSLEPIRSVRGTVDGLMAVAVDVTAQVAARQGLERSHAERQRLLENAEAASRAKDEFLAMLGHELRNPLSPIVTALHVMGLRQDSSTAKEQAIIQRQVDHLVRLVDDLLDVSTIARGKVQLKLGSTPLADILTKSIEMASYLLDQRHHTLSVDAPPEPVLFYGDAARLAQVVANLLTNAARYTPPRGAIRLGAALDGADIVITVRDNGIGIAPDLLPHLFEMFYQGRRGIDRAEGGLGLGLALVKNLVAMHGGTVRADSAGAGQGSEFSIRLPRRIDERTATLAAPATKPPPVGARRILIVDDNRDAGETLAEVLRMDGHTVRVAFEPLTGLALAEHFKPDVALLDIGLPDMDGHELAHRFRERFDASACQLVALTGYGQDADKARSAQAGFAAHLVKPVDLDRLREVLRLASG